MPDGDITLDGQTCFVDGNWMHVRCYDIKLDASSRRSSTSGERRALVHGFSDELIINYGDDYPGGVTIRGEIKIPGKIKQNHLRLQTHDLHLDHPDRRSTTGGERRALVHGVGDELVLNWAKDYPGGVVCHGNFEVQKSGVFRLRNNSGNVTAELDKDGNLTLGGNNTDGDLICKNTAGQEIIHIDAQGKMMEFKDTSETSRIRIDTDHFSSWPAWPGESAPTRLDLITEMKKMKQEILALRAMVDELASTP